MCCTLKIVNTIKDKTYPVTSEVYGMLSNTAFLAMNAIKRETIAMSDMTPSSSQKATTTEAIIRTVAVIDK